MAPFGILFKGYVTVAIIHVAEILGAKIHFIGSLQSPLVFVRLAPKFYLVAEYKALSTL